MTDDLVTRLRALAALLKPDIKWVLTDLKQGFLAERIEKSEAALREAAYGLELCQTRRDALDEGWTEEIRLRGGNLLELDALKAENASAWKAGIQQEKEIADLKALLAEAETRHQGLFDAAADAQERAEKAEAEAAALREALAVIAAPLPADYGWATVKAREALSQPGPGAAYQERTRKLEAVAEAARNHKHPCQYLVDDAAECDLCQRLAALE